MMKRGDERTPRALRAQKMKRLSSLVREESTFRSTVSSAPRVENVKIKKETYVSRLCLSVCLSAYLPVCLSVCLSSLFLVPSSNRLCARSRRTKGAAPCEGAADIRGAGQAFPTPSRGGGEQAWGVRLYHGESPRCVRKKPAGSCFPKPGTWLAAPPNSRQVGGLQHPQVCATVEALRRAVSACKANETGGEAPRDSRRCSARGEEGEGERESATGGNL